MQEVRVVRAEPFPDQDDEVVYPRLSEKKLQWLEKKKGGERRSFEVGDVLYEHAVRDAPFFVLLSGEVEFVDRKPGKDVHVAAAGARTYIGDIAAFTGSRRSRPRWRCSRPRRWCSNARRCGGWSPTGPSSAK